MGPNPDLSPACPVWPSIRRLGPAGFTKLNTMAFASSLSEKWIVCVSQLVMGTILAAAFH